mgnify:FL=1
MSLKHLWERLNSETPKALKVVSKVCFAISGMCTAMSVSLAAFEKTATVSITLGIIAGITGGIATGCNLATTDPTLQTK